MPGPIGQAPLQKRKEDWGRHLRSWIVPSSKSSLLLSRLTMPLELSPSLTREVQVCQGCSSTETEPTPLSGSSAPPSNATILPSSQEVSLDITADCLSNSSRCAAPETAQDSFLGCHDTSLLGLPRHPPEPDWLPVTCLAPGGED